MKKTRIKKKKKRNNNYFIYIILYSNIYMAKRKTKITQKQKQSVSQNVVIQLAEKVEKKRKRRAKKKPSPTEGVDSLYLQGRQPPNVVYQYSNIIPQEPFATPIPVRQPMKIKENMPVLEDVGTVGTEGAVEILDLPTKKETLAELETPVPSAFIQPFKPSQITDTTNISTPFQQVPLGSLTRLFGMGADDIFEMSNPLLNEEGGLIRKRKPRGKKADINISDMTPTVNLLKSQIKRNSKADLINRYEFMTGDPAPKMNAAELKKLVEKMENR
jgi:hypothetical protein